MTSAVLAGLLLRQPFQPFRFVFADNTEVCVRRRAGQAQARRPDRGRVLQQRRRVDHRSRPCRADRGGCLMDIASDSLSAAFGLALLIALAIELIMVSP